MESEFRTTSTSDRTVIAPVNESFAKLGTNKTEFLKSARVRISEYTVYYFTK
jgi:uncharacterized surface protein with fasciclin (FAS1) repeats